MSAPAQGMRMAKEAQVFTERMRDGVYTSAPDTSTTPQGGAAAVSFARKFDAKDKMDDEMNLKMQLMDEDGMTPFGQVYYDDKVGRWLERKEAAAEAANFDSYFGNNFNKNDLASRQWAQQIHPEWYAAREREMAERAEMVLKLKGIQLRGPQSADDLRMMYLIESGRVALPEDWDQIGPGVRTKKDFKAKKKANERNYVAGLIRFPLFLTNGQREVRAEGNDDAGAWGSQAGATNRFPVGEPPKVKKRQNVPLSSAQNGKTLGGNFLKLLERGQ